MNTTMLRAWAVRCEGETCIVIARTPNRAKRITQLSAQSVGLDAQWTAITVRRAKQFDALALFREIGPITTTVAEAMVKP
jgi:hypothetical protein